MLDNDAGAIIDCTVLVAHALTVSTLKERYVRNKMVYINHTDKLMQLKPT